VIGVTPASPESKAKSDSLHSAESQHGDVVRVRTRDAGRADLGVLSPGNHQGRRIFGPQQLFAGGFRARTNALAKRPST
jgi:hypothetical protein